MSDSLADTIKPKSDQLNADDLITGPITVMITSVSRGTADQPVNVAITGGHQPYKPCKSMRRVMIAAWGDKGDDWIGQCLTLYCDPSVKFGGVALGGIRISHMSGINGQLSMMLTTTRSRRAQYTVEQLPDYPGDKFTAALTKMNEAIKAGKMTRDQVVTQCLKTGVLNADQLAAIEG